MCVSGMDIASKLGLQRTDLLAPQLRISVDDNSGLTIVGAACILITGPAGHTTRQLVYFADNVTDFFISKAACRDLSIIDDNFPGATRKQPAPPPPTKPPGFGTLGGSSSSKGGFSHASLHCSNQQPSYVQPGLYGSTPSYYATNVPTQQPLQVLYQQLPQVQPALHPPTNPQGLGNPGGFTQDSGVYTSAAYSQPNYYPLHIL